LFSKLTNSANTYFFELTIKQLILAKVQLNFEEILVKFQIKELEINNFELEIIQILDYQWFIFKECFSKYLIIRCLRLL
jgi:hypothetical protein